MKARRQKSPGDMTTGVSFLDLQQSKGEERVGLVVGGRGAKEKNQYEANNSRIIMGYHSTFQHLQLL
jgi:hypothetical protein